ncbi:MAG: hypothetical protein ACM31C_23380 [Acidobacteriota bacterium]
MDPACGRCGGATSDYRCEDCAVLEVDEAARRQRRTALKLVGLGVILAAIAIVLATNGIDFGYTRGDDDSGPLWMLAGIGALGCFGVALGLVTYRPRLRR